MLCMFRAVSLPVIRSSRTVHSIWYVPDLLAATAIIQYLRMFRCL